MKKLNDFPDPISTMRDIMMHLGDIINTVWETSFVIWVPPRYWTPPHGTASTTCIMISYGTQITKDGVPHDTAHPHGTRHTYRLKMLVYIYIVFPRINARGVYFKIRDFRGAFIRGGRLFEGGRLFQNFKNSGNRIWTYKNKKKTFMPCDQCYLHCDMLANYSHTYKN